MIKPGVPAFEYRHAPDPHEIDEVLLPALEELRSGALPSRPRRRDEQGEGIMRIHDANWMQVEDYLKRDDRAVLPLGSTEQHAGLSLMVDSILAERVSAEAAEPLGVPVFPPLSYGITPYFMAFPGTVSLRVETLIHGRPGHPGLPARPRLPPHRPRQRPWRQPAGAVLGRRMDGRPSRTAA